MAAQVLEPLVPIILLLACAAIGGWLIGRAIRGSRPKAEMTRPRVAISGSYLRDAHVKSLSPHTSMRCAFEAIYFCLCEVAETRGLEVGGREHPSDELLCAGLAAFGTSPDDQKKVVLLARWTTEVTPALPEMRIQEACELAVRVYRKTVDLLSSSTTQ
jgi:hypothetical protein